MLTNILKSCEQYGLKLKGGTIWQYLKSAEWQYMGREKGCPVWYLFLRGEKFQNSYNDNGVPIGYIYCLKKFLPAINPAELEKVNCIF